MIKTNSKAFIVANNLPPINDGVGHYAYNLYQRLKTIIVDVKIITNNTNSHNTYLGNPDIIELGIDSWNWRACWKFFKAIRKQKPQWLLIQYVPYSFAKNGFPLFFIFFLILLRLGGSKIQVSFHEIAVRFLDNGFKSFFRALLQRVIAYTLCCISTSILTSNNYYALLLYPFKTEVIPVPSNFENIISSEFKTEVNYTNRIIITSTANRCYDIFFQVISLLTKKHLNDFIVNITGRSDDSDISRINNLTQKYCLYNVIKYKVNLTENEYCTILSSTDMFLHLEYVSTKGTGGVSTKSGVMATAMSFGLPIITTKGDMTDINIFKNKTNLLFVPYDNPDLAADEIHILINNIAFRKILSNGARDTFKNYMQWSNSINYYLKILA